MKIIKGEERVEVGALVACIYGPPGVGKTSLASSTVKPLLLDFDLGGHRSEFRPDSVRPSKWEDINFKPADLAGYEAIIVDTVGRCLDVMAVDIVRKQPKLGYGGTLTLQGYGVLAARFASWIGMVTALGVDVILVAHSTEKQQDDVLVERLDIRGSSKEEIHKRSDLMGRMRVAGGTRIVTFDPGETSYGKNPGGLASPISIPDLHSEPLFFASLLQATREKINSRGVPDERTPVIKEIGAFIRSHPGSEDDAAAIAKRLGVKSLKELPLEDLVAALSELREVAG